MTTGRVNERPSLHGAPTRPVLIVGLLGLNGWVTCVGLPLWHVERLGALSSWAIAAAVVGLPVLGLGVLALARRRRLASLILAAIVPACFLAPAAIQPTLVRSSVLSPAAVAVAGVSFAVYLIGSCWASGAARVQPLATKVEPLEDHTPRGIKWLSWILLATAAAAAAVAIGTAHLQPFDPSGARVRVLSAGALALWTAAVFGIVAPALRHRRPWPLPTASRGAALVWLLVVALGGIMLALSLLD